MNYLVNKLQLFEWEEARYAEMFRYFPYLVAGTLNIQFFLCIRENEVTVDVYYTVVADIYKTQTIYFTTT